jgi:hypothetical protein
VTRLVATVVTAACAMVATVVPAAGSAATASTPGNGSPPATLHLDHRGPSSVTLGRSIRHTITLRNSGPGVATGVTMGVDRGTLSMSSCAVDGVGVSCTDVESGSLMVGDVARDAVVELTVILTAPTKAAAGTRVKVVSTASSDSSRPSLVTRQQVVTLTGLEPPTVERPRRSSHETTRRPTFSGRADPGSTVTVRNGKTELCRARVSRKAADAGTWSCRPRSDLRYGTVRARIVQKDANGVKSPPVIVTFTVARPASRPTAREPERPPPRTGQSPTPTPDRRPAPSRHTSKPAPPVVSSAPRAIPLTLRLAQQRIPPGTVAALRGTVGPNRTDQTVPLTVSGTMDRGMAYRSVLVDGEPCTTSTLTFSCTISLPPGESAELELRVFADALNAPATARQRLSLVAPDNELDNAATITSAVTDLNETTSLAADVRSFPGSLIVLLALFLFALAATQAERRTRRDPREN